MKRKDINRWLEEAAFQQNPTPPSSTLREGIVDEFAQDTKRVKMSASGASTPRKRSRPVDDVEASSLFSGLTDRTRFDPSAQSSSAQSRQRSPVRELLNELPHSTPSIHCTRPKNVPLPEDVIFLRKALCQGFGSKVIPIELKERIEEVDPEAATEIPDFAYDNSRNLQPSQLDALWADVDDVFQAAAECDEHSQDENAWCSEVVQLILRRGARLCSNLQVKNV
ncbi:uncharacterized protein LDX57_008248 [Aspergillus melleus]|uniref:uncharacterized protein n=1 Tax=Aspergillus melleus TaxID=138277 RepID=UPI001E8E0467|nr:uncharacterized protein LDX57_008248 [Aspergillus melleus]KAH8430584.1 hypothetical protein LDX57_008248 [Aspergillus melleus]